MPSASQMRLVMVLSMATADAMTPGPVYGMPISSSAPCTVPSSPKRPCRVMKQRAKPCSFRANRFCCAGSKACASTPLLNKASSTPRPDMRDTSRSAERPPISTATLPKFFGSIACIFFPLICHYSLRRLPAARPLRRWSLRPCTTPHLRHAPRCARLPETRPHLPQTPAPPGLPRARPA